MTRPQIPALLALSLWLGASAQASLTPGCAPGVVVDSVPPGGTADRLGLAVGTRLLSWERPPAPPANPQGASGTLVTVWDWYTAAREQSPRGAMRLEVEGPEGRRLLDLPLGGGWGFAQVRPALSPVDLASVREAEGATPSKEGPRGAEILEALAGRLEASGQVAEALWARMEAAAYRRGAGDLAGAERLYALALEPPLRERYPGAAFQALDALADLRHGARDAAGAEEALRRQLDLAVATWGEGPSAAAALTSLNSLLWERGQYGLSEETNARAVHLLEAVAPGTLELSRALNNLGNARWVRGDLAGAEAAYRRSLALKEALAPESSTVASGLNNLGLLADERGDLESAERLLLRALAIRERLEPGGPLAGKTLHNLGMVAMRRGLLEEATIYYGRALAVREKADPQSTDTASTLMALGRVAVAQGDLEAAEALIRRGVSIYTERYPESLDLPRSQSFLARVLADRGDLAEAERLLRGALAHFEARAPGNLNLSLTLNFLASVLQRRGDPAGAEALFRREVEFLARVAPGSREEAEALAALGRLLRDRGEREAARDLLGRAVEALEHQEARLGGGSGATESFSGLGADIYRDLVELQAEAGALPDAFAVLERFRARGLLEMLAARDLDFATDAPPELLRRQKLADAEYDRVQAELARLSSGGDPHKAAASRARLQELGLERREAADALRAASPALASLREPQPLDLEGARRALPPGCLFLSYCVGERSTWLFALLDGRLSAHRIPISRAELGREVRRMRSFLAGPDLPEEALAGASGHLFQLLVAPARRKLDRCERVVVCPDGPLHGLPFAALVAPRGRYLVEARPLSSTLSLTVLAERRAAPRAPAPAARLAVFAVPDRGEGDPLGLPPLPGAREEVEALSRLFAGGAVVRVGSAATEEAAVGAAGTARYLHFACHGILEDRFPLNSGLALARAGEDGPGGQGLLQAWEILESFRTGAELVTLSACETGLGREVGGEGMVGLTRAFLYAGARSVVSSYWSVGDASTARLMAAFYRRLERGEARDRALQGAQVEMIRAGGRAAHPHAWAAFTLSGDWR